MNANIILCEIWDSLCPGFAPNHFLPFLLFLSFLGLFLLGVFFGPVCLPRRKRSILLDASTCNACITNDGGRWPRQATPPIRIIITIVFKNPRFLRVGRRKKMTPIECHPEPSNFPHFPPQTHKPWPGKRNGGTATVVSHKCVGRRASSKPNCSLVRMVPVSSRKPI